MIEQDARSCNLVDTRAAGDVAAPGRASEPAAKRPLVVHTKSSATFHTVLDQNTGEIQQFRLDAKRREYVQVSDDDAARIDARERRFLLQRESRRLLIDRETPRGGEWRVVGCNRRRVSPEVSVLYSASRKKAHFGGVMVCGSVWTCPVCAAKVGERRKAELSAASEVHLAAGGGQYMVTLTFRHTRNDSVSDLVSRLRKALVWLRKHRTYKRLLQYTGFVGLIRALEVTHGEENGWHPHVHELWLTDKPLPRSAIRLMQADLFELWRRACAVAGLGEPNRRAGVNVIQAESAQDYINKFGYEPKWGVTSELTKAHSKRGRAKSRTPFDLLRASADGDFRAGSLFRDFADAFFGSRQLFWSPGLKAAFQIDDVSDEELAALEDDRARELCRITADQWRALLSLGFEARSVVLSLAESGGAQTVLDFVETISTCSSLVVDKQPGTDPVPRRRRKPVARILVVPRLESVPSMRRLLPASGLLLANPRLSPLLPCS